MAAKPKMSDPATGVLERGVMEGSLESGINGGGVVEMVGRRRRREE